MISFTIVNQTSSCTTAGGSDLPQGLVGFLVAETHPAVLKHGHSPTSWSRELPIKKLPRRNPCVWSPVWMDQQRLWLLWQLCKGQVTESRNTGSPCSDFHDETSGVPCRAEASSETRPIYALPSLFYFLPLSFPLPWDCTWPLPIKIKCLYINFCLRFCLQRIHVDKWKPFFKLAVKW